MAVAESKVIHLIVVKVAAGVSETSAHSTRYLNPKDRHIPMDTYPMCFI